MIDDLVLQVIRWCFYRIGIRDKEHRFFTVEIRRMGFLIKQGPRSIFSTVLYNNNIHAHFASCSVSDFMNLLGIVFHHGRFGLFGTSG